ncbi:MAG TPA: hypothetical protein DCX64_01455 [Gammaproteobacteria bacterium]|jgi:hypothetical protein|nr:hypothetical protein [Gammaproteobacteria bacterium]|tara:strand:+ start:5554 stop:6234 length:681 start_codon:yes stop_codon:yes gene_type:complete
MQGLGLTNNQNIKYKLVRSERKTLSLQINNKAQLIVRSPHRLSNKEIEKFICEKSEWINNKIALSQSNIVSKHRYIENEDFLYLGNLYPLILSKQIKALLFDGKSFISSIGDKEDFLKWYKSAFTKIAIPRLNYYADTFQLKYNKVRIKAQKTLWGSCSKENNINLNYLLIMAPVAVIDYVIVHELAHTVYKNHSKMFWALVASILPEYKNSIKWLKENGYKLHSL